MRVTSSYGTAIHGRLSPQAILDPSVYGGWAGDGQAWWLVCCVREPVLKHGPNTAYGKKGRERPYYASDDVQELAAGDCAAFLAPTRGSAGASPSQFANNLRSIARVGSKTRTQSEGTCGAWPWLERDD